MRLTDLMLEFSPNLGVPHTRAMGEGLFEIRVKDQEGIARVFYCTVVRRRMVMLYAFIKKSQKTPKRGEIKGHKYLFPLPPASTLRRSGGEGELASG